MDGNCSGNWRSRSLGSDSGVVQRHAGTCSTLCCFVFPVRTLSVAHAWDLSLDRSCPDRLRSWSRASRSSVLLAIMKEVHRPRALTSACDCRKVRAFEASRPDLCKLRNERDTDKHEIS